MRNSSYSFMAILLKLHRCLGHGQKTCMWFGYNPYYFLSIFPQFELSLSQALLLSTYVDSRYLVRVTPPINFTYFRRFLISLKNLAGEHKFSEVTCFNKF